MTLLAPVEHAPTPRVGIDVVDTDRLAALLTRHPRARNRLFTDQERQHRDRASTVTELAARLAAKEATLKAFGVGLWSVGWHDIETVTDASGRPHLALTGGAARLAAAQQWQHWDVSLTHDAGIAAAIVVAVCTPVTP